MFSEADGVPGLVADRYGDTIVCQFTTAGADAWRDVLADALFALPGVACVYERSDADVREREGLPPRVGLLRGTEPSPDLVANEAGFRFAVDVAGGHKTGFYLDQRNARRAVAHGRRGPASAERVLATPARSASSPRPAARRASRRSTRPGRRSRWPRATAS